jgi:tRNA(adenine34) deaminase
MGGKEKMWNQLSKPWQEAFSLAWESYRTNTIPIGAIIVDQNQNIISKGRNMIFDKTSCNILAGTYMAHAEMTAMMQIKEAEHPNVKSYTLYTTMEPCPMCFGTMVMMGIRHLEYAARDGFAGATLLNDKLEYVKNKNIKIEGGNGERQSFHIVLHSAFECERKHPRMQELLDSWSEYCPKEVKLGVQLYEENYFRHLVHQNLDIASIYDDVIYRYHNQRV